MSAEPESSPTVKLKVNEEKWSKQLMDAGWTAIPSIFIERQRALGLDAVDMNIVLHLAARWWAADNKPWPSKKTIADAVGVDPRTIQRRIAALEERKLIRREERRIAGIGSKTNVYHLEGLIKAAQPFAAEKIKEAETREKEKSDRARRKRQTS